MRSFALEWTARETEELLLSFPPGIFRQPFFAQVSAFASSCAIARRFPPRVTLLRALLLHHFNYLRLHAYDRVYSGLWKLMTSFVAWEDAVDLIWREIALPAAELPPTFVIDLHLAQQLAAAGSRNPSHSIIAQVTAALRPLLLPGLQCRVRPLDGEIRGRTRGRRPAAQGAN
jgi:hypothetical protein